MALTLRPVIPEDERFLFEVYASTRAEELAAWGWSAEQQEPFLRLQFMAQKGSYSAQYPGADNDIIVLDGKDIGRFYFIRSERHIVLIDFALLPEYRGRGIGGELLKRVLDETARDKKTCRLQVLKTNRAMRLYERLGFVKTGESGMYFEMEWQPQLVKGD
jgi:ribosomal protein S18 acetylase RimI-like enzyme